MKRILIFVGLKIAELTGVCIAWGIDYHIACRVNIAGNYEATKPELYVLSFLFTVLTCLLLFAGYKLLCSIIEANWDKAGELEKKWKRGK